MTWLGALVFAFICFAATADARVIAVLFDDSGSMSGRIQLPAFGVQLLVSTLDGRAGEDRVIAARMSNVGTANAVEAIDIRTTDLQQRAIDTIAARWPVPEGGTPFQQIEMVLRRIAGTQQAGEEAFFIIVTDGAFNQGGTSNPLPPPPQEVMRQAFESYKPQLKGPLRVDFLLIAADDPEVVAAVEQQGIRAAFLQTFNGDASQGRHDISNAADLVETVKDIVARVAATDRQGQDRFIELRGNTIAIDSPLSIKRIVAVSANRANAPPARAGTPQFGVAERIDLASRMQHPDTRGAWAEERLAGLSTHLLLHPALPPGHYEVPFDREPAGVFLLFQTDAALRLGLRDAAGAMIQAEHGVHRIARGAEATLVLEVVDRAGEQVVTVPISQLGDATTFRAALDLAGRRTDLDARASPAADVATAVLPTGSAGRGKVDASMRVEGFVSTFAQPLELEILDIAGAVTLRLEGVEPCATCAADEVRYTILARQPPRAIARLTVETTAPLDGVLALRLADAPAWLSLADASGAPLSGAPVRANEPLRIEAFIFAAADVAALSEAGAGRPQVLVRADLAGGPQGSAQAGAHIQLVPGEASLKLTGHSQDPTGAAPLALGIDALQEGSEALDLALIDALAGAEAGTVTVTADSRFVVFAPIAEGERIALRPTVGPWCACFAFLDRGERRLQVAWTGPGGLQSAAADVAVVIETPWRQLAWPCAKLLLLLVLGVYLAWWALAWLRARRFPRRSGVSVYFGPREDRLYRQLRRWDWTPFRALLAPFAGIPHEVRRVEGLALRAAGSGADILMDRSDSQFRIETLNRTIAECRADNPKMATYKLNWNDTVERRDSGLRRLTLLRRPEDQAS